MEDSTVDSTGEIQVVNMEDSMEVSMGGNMVVPTNMEDSNMPIDTEELKVM